MPLTPAHAAAAWPLRRAWPALPLAPLVIGTLSPDFEYLLRLNTSSRIAHSIGGLFVFCLPVSFLVWAIFRRLVRPAVIDILPRHLARTIRPDRASMTAAAAAILAGAITHLVWDGFTHETGWLVIALPALGGEVAPRLVPGLRWFKLLQHASTAAGSLAVAWWVGRWFAALPAEARRPQAGELRRLLAVMFGVATAGVVAALLNATRNLHGGLSGVLSLAAVGGMAGLAVALTGLGGYSALRRRRRASRVSRD